MASDEDRRRRRRGRVPDHVDFTLMTRRALVFAARQPPFPATHGAGIRTLRLLTGLAEEFDTIFVTFVSPGGATPSEVRRGLSGIEVITVPAPAESKRLSQLQSLLSSRSWQFGRFPESPLAAALVRAVQRSGAEVLHLDDLAVALPPPPTTPLVAFAPHNVEHRIIRGTAEAAHGERRLFAAIEWRKIKREEERVWRRTPLCIGVSQLDADVFKAGGAERVDVCPNGTDPVKRLPLRGRNHDEAFRMLFVGTASYQPYERGLAWFIRHVLPQLRERVWATLDVVGSPPTKPIPDPSVTYRGRVPSVSRWYEQAHVVVVPVFHGSGTRLKLIEAMAFGRPVVSTRLGAEGLPVRPGVHYLAAEEVQEFVEVLVALARRCVAPDPGLEKMLTIARDAISDLTWPSISRRLAALYAGAVEHRGPLSAAGGQAE